MSENAYTQQLKQAMSDFQQAQRQEDPLPLPPAANRAALSPEQQLELFNEWTSWINSRPQNTWTSEEKNAIRVASVKALKDLGY